MQKVQGADKIIKFILWRGDATSTLPKERKH